MQIIHQLTIAKQTLAPRWLVLYRLFSEIRLTDGQAFYVNLIFEPERLERQGIDSIMRDAERIIAGRIAEQ